MHSNTKGRKIPKLASAFRRCLASYAAVLADITEFLCEVGWYPIIIPFRPGTLYKEISLDYFQGHSRLIGPIDSRLFYALRDLVTGRAGLAPVAVAWPFFKKPLLNLRPWVSAATSGISA